MTFVLVGGPMSEVQPEQVQWLWPGRIPFGKLTVIDGDPGLAKSILTLDLASRVTRGAAMPDGAATTPGTVIVLTAEDGLGDTVRPRLDALEADVAKVFAFTATVAEAETGELLPITLPTHLPALADRIREVSARLVVVDPLMAYLSSEVNTRIDHDVRRLLAQLAQLAEETGAAIVLVRHLNKTNTGPAIYRGGGSIGIIGAARSGLLVARDPDDENRRILAVIKSNLAPEAPSLRFHVETAANGAACLAWEGESTHRANALVCLPGDEAERSELDQARQFVREFLGDKEAPVRTVKELEFVARNLGISQATLRRARRDLGVVSERTGGIASDGAWTVRLPIKGAHERVSGNGRKPGTSAKGFVSELDRQDRRDSDPDQVARDAQREDGA
jgi:archaellum biogenesis ATPase FlaH